MDAVRAGVSKGRKRAFKLTPPEPSEDQLHRAIADLLDAVLIWEQAAWTHFPAGGYFLTPAARARLYRLGLRAGWPDVLICYQGKSLWLEVKKAGGTLSADQRRRHKQLALVGHAVVVVRRIEDVIAALRQYGVPHLQARMAESYHAKTAVEPGAAQVHAPQPAPRAVS